MRQNYWQQFMLADIRHKEKIVKLDKRNVVTISNGFFKPRIINLIN